MARKRKVHTPAQKAKVALDAVRARATLQHKEKNLRLRQRALHVEPVEVVR